MDHKGVAVFLEKAKTLGSRLGLERVSRLCALLGNPQDSFPIVHVAGTNGKGSTASMIAAGLTAAGARTGLYTSPYLIDLKEILGIDGDPITQAEFDEMAAIVAEQGKALETDGHGPTAFELETAMAFLWFKQRNCDIAVIETGLGGRLDATNVIRKAAVSVITGISYDHVNILGDTLTKIAFEKCGIIKPGGVTVCCPCQPDEAMAVIRQRSAEEGNHLILPDGSAIAVHESGLWGSRFTYSGLEMSIRMPGRHQVHNAVTAIEALRVSGQACGIFVSDRHIAAGIAAVRLPMRQEWIEGSPPVLLDGAHNLDKLTALAETIRTHLDGRKIVAVMGMLSDKQFEPSIAMIAGLCQSFIACAPHSDRALDSQTTASIARHQCAEVIVEDDVGRAVALAIRSAGEDGAVVVCGSFYLAGPARASLIDVPHSAYFK